MSSAQNVGELIRDNEAEILDEWLRELGKSLARGGAARESEFRSDCAEFLSLVAQATRSASLEDAASAAFQPARDLLVRFSRQRTLQGFPPSETAGFVFALKRPLFARIRAAHPKDPDTLFSHIRAVNDFLDRLGLHTTEVYQTAREELITRQQHEMLELSTPVVKLWDGILALPMIGTLDSERTQIVMETLLQRIVETASEVAILDITGVPTVDTLVAQHLLKTVAAARLMGVECVISGIRPQIAQTIVHLGVDLGDVVTKATLADAFAFALARRGMRVSRAVSA